VTDPGAPRRRGRHSSPDDASGVPTSWLPAQPAPSGWAAEGPARQAEATHPGPRVRSHPDDTAAWAPVPARRRSDVLTGAPTGGMRRLPAYRDSEETGPLPMEWQHGGDRRDPRPSREELRSGWRAHEDDDGRHPSAPLPPPPPGAWSKLGRRGESDDDAPTQAQPALGPDAAHDAGDHEYDGAGWEDETGGLEVIGANVDDDLPRRGRRRARADEHDADLHDAEIHDAEIHDAEIHDDLHDDAIPLEPYDRRGGRRRRRRPLAVAIALVVLAALGAGVFFGGQKLLGLFVAEDYKGQGTGSVSIRVQDGDTLTDIAHTLVGDDVIASAKPFTDAAKADPAAMGITAGVYSMRKHMSGAAALDQLLDPSSRLYSRVTIPEGTTAANTLQKIAEATGMPLADLQAAAANPAALGLPAYANGSLEGFLFPATYDVQPGDTAADVLSAMVTRTVQALDQLGVPEDQRLSVLTEASIVQAEAGSTDDMAKVARVLDNRLAAGMPLQLDTTVNYANGKTGITTTPEDRQNPSPYNTYMHAGLPPGPIGNPGEDAIRAVLTPAQGDWLFFVVVNPDTGETRFAATAEEHAANVALFQAWLREHPGG
jgi:UPF0755 protein